MKVILTQLSLTEEGKAKSAEFTVMEEKDGISERTGTYEVSKDGVSNKGVAVPVWWDHITVIETAWEHLENKTHDLLKGAFDVAAEPATTDGE